MFCANLFISGCAKVHSIKSVCHGMMVKMSADVMYRDRHLLAGLVDELL